MPYKDPEKKRQHEHEYWHRSPKAKARSRRWVDANRAQQNASNRCCYYANRTERIAKAVAYHAAHPEIAQKSQRNWVLRNPEHAKALSVKHSACRRARKMAIGMNDFTITQWALTRFSYNYCCAYCGKKQERLTQDHVIPIVNGGPYTASNIVPACKSCNSKKGTKLAMPFVSNQMVITECA